MLLGNEEEKRKREKESVQNFDVLLSDEKNFDFIDIREKLKIDFDRSFGILFILLISLTS